MKYSILLLLGCLVGLVSCDKVGLQEYRADVTYVCFTKSALQDTMFLSFKVYDKDTVTIPVPVKRMGKYSTEDMEYEMEADMSLTTLPQEYYRVPEKCIFDKCVETDTFYVQLYNYDELQDSSRLLVLKLKPSELIQEGLMENRRYIISATDRLVRPTWWTELNGGHNGNYFFNIAEQYYLGKYSEKKYSIFLQALQEDGVTFDGKDLSVLRIYSLRVKRYLEDYEYETGEILWDEENNEPMYVPIAG